jgi:hypothetical protein
MRRPGAKEQPNLLKAAITIRNAWPRLKDGGEGAITRLAAR